MDIMDVVVNNAVSVLLAAMRKIADTLASPFTRQRVYWHQIKKGIRHLHRRMHDEGYTPTHIICCGRGGAIIGAMLSCRFNDVVPTTVVHVESADRNYAVEEGVRLGRPGALIDSYPLPSGLRNCLLLCVDVVGGTTLSSAQDALEGNDCEITALSSLFWHPDAFEIKRRSKGRLYWYKMRSRRQKYPWSGPSCR